MSDVRRDRAERLELWVDGLLEGEERAAFERELAEDPALRRELARQRELERRLGAAFALPARLGERAREAALEAAHDAGAPVERGGTWRALVPLAAAALVVAALAAGWRTWTGRGAVTDAPPRGGDRVAAGPVALEEVWEELRALPAWPADGAPAPAAACSTEGALAAHVAERHGGSLFLRVVSDRAVDGPFDCAAWPGASALVGRDAGGAAALLVCSAAGDPRPALPPGSALRLHRRALDGLVLYELSERDRPAFLDLFFTAPPATGPAQAAPPLRSDGERD